MLAILIVLTLQVVETARPAEVPEIAVSNSAATRTLENMKGLGQPNQPRLKVPAPGRRNSFVSRNFLDVLRPAEIARIAVERYDPRSTPWGGSQEWAPDSLRTEIQGLISVPMENGDMDPEINWSELSNWSVAATVVFKDGRQGKLLFDGLHACYEDPDGLRWFFRYHLKRT